MCPVHRHQDTSRYIKIHQDTSRYICICHFGYDDGIETFPQPPRYVSCMYPACIPHVSRMCPACILITTEDTCIPHVSRMYPACIPHVSRMYPFISDTSLSGCLSGSPDAVEIHVSHYVFLYVSRMYPVCILITSEDTCILHVSRMYLAPQIRTSLHTFEIHVSHDVSLMYPACILYVSWNHCRYMYSACIPHKSLHVSHMYSS